MRTRMSWVLTVLGALCIVAGLAVILILGPDSRFSTGPHAVDTDGIAVVTAPKVISWADVQIDVLAEVPAQKPVFVGLGNSVDVQDYVRETARVEVTDFHTPWKPKTRQVDGKPGLPGAPTALDWWIADSAGRGGATISTNLPEETVSLAILAVGDTNLSGLKVSLAYGVKGGFAKGLGLLLLGVGAVLLGRQLRRGEDIWAHDDEDDEEVVYVFVDEDGVEHEISADEAEDYEVVDEEVVERPTLPDTNPSRAAEITAALGSRLKAARSKLAARFELTPKVIRPTVSVPDEDDGEDEVVYIFVDENGVEREITAAEAQAYDFIDEVVVDDGVAEPAPPSTTAERVMYVFVDEDGVEHEVSEDELADFEVVDPEEDKS